MNKASRSTTPMMEQFYAAKEQFPDSILFFRMGDFFEMFEDDAVTASKILGIALTSRNKSSDNQTPMCGVPHHSYQQYMLKLIRAGYKVAICEQLEDPAEAKGIVKRGVTRVVSPGTVMDEGEIADSSNNFLVAVYISGGIYYIASADVSTGEVYLVKTAEKNAVDIIASFQPKEVLSQLPVNVPGAVRIIRVPLTPAKTAKNTAEIYKVTSEQTLGIDDPKMTVPFDMIAGYVSESMLRVNWARPKVIHEEDNLVIDRIAARTLEITESAMPGGSALLSVLNHTNTPMGLRMLKWRLLNPSRNADVINKRLDIVEYFVNKWIYTQELEKLLSGLYDIERITNRVASKRVNPRELVWLRDSLSGLPCIADMLESSGVQEIKALGDRLHDCGRLADLIAVSIEDEPPLTLKDGGIIRAGYNNTVDELRKVKSGGRQMVAAMEADLKRATGINSLKISYNKVFGYYIEVSKTNAAKVPDSFERKQTLVNAERYVTPELKDLENTIYNAEDRLSGLEYDLFCSIRDMIAESVDNLRTASSNMAQLDTYLSLARAAVMRNYCKPVVDESGRIDLTDARHPVVETNDKNPYVSNDIMLDNNESRMMLITGPNMAGKSTYMRSIALNVIMAHMGSFVPASKAHIGVVDRIFTRVGSSDNISRGESTFMVEMVETANILTHATAKSLIVLDEIGRGTSTFDGMSIAWAVSEYILRTLKAKTLFATHYHELTEIASVCEGVKNYTISVKEADNEVIFMRKIVPGTADKSYGIYVAQLAGLPPKVIKRAEEVLGDLESDDVNRTHTTRHEAVSGGTREVVVRPMLIFDEEHPVVERLKSLDINTLTPVNALNVVSDLKTMVGGQSETPVSKGNG